MQNTKNLVINKLLDLKFELSEYTPDYFRKETCNQRIAKETMLVNITDLTEDKILLKISIECDFNNTHPKEYIDLFNGGVRSLEQFLQLLDMLNLEE